MILSSLKAATSETARVLKGTTFWLVIACATAICVISGPFGTLEHLPPGLRLIYWGLQVSITGLAGLWASSLIRTQQWTNTPTLIGVSLVFGFVAFGIVVLFSLTLLAPMDKYPGTINLMFYSLPSASIIFFVLGLVLAAPSNDVQDTPARPRLFARLKHHCAASQILSLSAQDHYVEVVTDTGTELCLIRLADAIAEAEPQPGVKIHRSHWVAKSAVETLVVNGSGTQVVLKDSRRLPVSQSRLGALRDFLSS